MNYVYNIFINCGLMSKNFNKLIKISLSINNVKKRFYVYFYLAFFIHFFLNYLQSIQKILTHITGNFLFLFIPLSFLAVIILSRVCMHLHFRCSKLHILYIDFFSINMLEISKMHVIICISDYC